MNKRHFFDQLADEWDRQEAPDISLRLARVAELAELRAGQRVLDVGTGTGVLISHIQRFVGERGLIVALDISREMLRQAVTKAHGDNVRFILADMHQAPIGNDIFDRVICNAVFPHFDDKRRALREAWRVLRAGGLLIISHPIGREAVHRLHSQYQQVAEDRVPDASTMCAMLEGAGWTGVQVIDEPEFYLARAYKRLFAG